MCRLEQRQRGRSVHFEGKRHPVPRIPARAAQSGGDGLASTAPAVVLVTATNRVYARRLSVLLETGDAAGIVALQRARLGWVVPAAGVFLLVAMVLAERILGLF